MGPITPADLRQMQAANDAGNARANAVLYDMLNPANLLNDARDLGNIVKNDPTLPRRFAGEVACSMLEDMKLLARTCIVAAAVIAPAVRVEQFLENSFGKDKSPLEDLGMDAAILSTLSLAFVSLCFLADKVNPAAAPAARRD